MAGVKKRAWGRSGSRVAAQGVTPLDNTDVEDLICVSVHEENSSACTPIDLQCPETISNSDLIKTLVQMKVPIPRCDDCNSSREQLLSLFKKHIMPKPQRDRHGVKTKRERKADSPMDLEPSFDWECAEIYSESRKRKLPVEAPFLEAVVSAKRPPPPIASVASMASDHRPTDSPALVLPSTKPAVHRVVKPMPSGRGANTVQKPSSPEIVQSTSKQESPGLIAKECLQTPNQPPKEQYKKKTITWP